jgi:hypothetical protein
LVEVNQKIPDRDEAELRPAVEGSEPSRRQGSSMKRPQAPLTPLSAREAMGVRGTAQKRMKRDEKTLDDADDVIHGSWYNIGPRGVNVDEGKHGFIPWAEFLLRLLLRGKFNLP